MKRHFTLIELLMVIVIIAILFSLLFPAFGKARKMANLAVCGSNLKQMHQLKSLYLKDNRNAFKPMEEGSSTTWIGRNGTGSSDRYRRNGLRISERPLNRYLGQDLKPDSDIKLVRCPAAGGAYIINEGTDYVANISSYSSRDNSYYLSGSGCKTSDRVSNPSVTVLMEESVAFDFNLGSSSSTTSYGQTIFWHTEPGDYRWTMIAVDGGFLNLQKVVNGSNSGYVNGALKYTYLTNKVN
jgi:prepilin-type N-terminal cleavage/methylation domain-containing protein